MSGKSFCVNIFSLLLCLPCIVWGRPVPDGVVSGDLVFRTGDEAISAVIRTMDSSGFSHVGMLYFRDKKPFVIHSTPAEHEGSKDGVVIDSLDFYISRAVNKKVTYYHVKAENNKRKQAIESALAYTGKPFSVTGGKGVYCTELVMLAWRQSGINIINGKKELNIPGFHSYIVLPENIVYSENVVYIDER